MEEKEGAELQQVMGLNADLLTSKALVPKFKFDGGIQIQGSSTGTFQ